MEANLSTHKTETKQKQTNTQIYVEIKHVMLNQPCLLSEPHRLRNCFVINTYFHKCNNNAMFCRDMVLNELTYFNCRDVNGIQLSEYSKNVIFIDCSSIFAEAYCISVSNPRPNLK